MKRNYDESPGSYESPVSGGSSASQASSPGSDDGISSGVFGSKDFCPEEHASMQRLLEQKIPVEYLSTRQGCGRGLLF